MSLSSEESGSGSSSSKRRLVSSACLVCRRRKVRCDSNDPCSNCVRRNEECVYKDNSKRAAKRRRLNEAVAQPDTRALSTTYTRNFYFNTFFETLNPNFHVVDLKASDANSPSKAVRFQHHAATALMARNMGHLDAAAKLLSEAQALSTDLMDDFSMRAALGFFTLGLCHWGEDFKKTQHYSRIAMSLYKSCPEEQQEEHAPMPALFRRFSDDKKLLVRGRVSYNPKHPAFAVLSMFDRHVAGYFAIAQTFPRRSLSFDIYCKLSMCARTELASDDFFSETAMQEMMQVNDIAINMFMGVNIPSYHPEYNMVLAQTRIYMIIALSARVVMGMCLGRYDIAAQAAAGSVKLLREHSGLLQVAYSFIVPSVAQVASFAEITGLGSVPGETPQALLATLLEVMEPLTKNYNSAKEMYNMLVAVMNEPHPTYLRGLVYPPWVAAPPPGAREVGISPLTPKQRLEASVGTASDGEGGRGRGGRGGARSVGSRDSSSSSSVSPFPDGSMSMPSSVSSRSPHAIGGSMYGGSAGGGGSSSSGDGGGGGGGRGYVSTGPAAPAGSTYGAPQFGGGATTMHVPGTATTTTTTTALLQPQSGSGRKSPQPASASPPAVQHAVQGVYNGGGLVYYVSGGMPGTMALAPAPAATTTTTTTTTTTVQNPYDQQSTNPPGQDLFDSGAVRFSGSIETPSPPQHAAPLPAGGAPAGAFYTQPLRDQFVAQSQHAMMGQSVSGTTTTATATGAVGGDAGGGVSAGADPSFVNPALLMTNPATGNMQTYYSNSFDDSSNYSQQNVHSGYN